MTEKRRSIESRLRDIYHQQIQTQEWIELIYRRLVRMAANEQEFDAALAEFVTVLDVSLTAIKAKLDSLDVPVDFSDELATLDAAKATLTDFVSANTAAPEGPPA